MRPPDPKKDPRLRPFRIAAYTLYLVVVCGVSLLVIVSVVRSVLAMTPAKPEMRGEALPVGRCVEKAEALWNELESERRTFSDASSGAALTLRWQAFRVDWMRRLRDTQARCASDTPERKRLAHVFDALERLGDLYTTSATQYGGEIVPAVKAFHQAIADQH